MKILHTSDWHLGHRLHEHSQQEEQILFLEWIIGIIQERGIDILIVSGDIFDVSVPSSQSQKMYYNFLINLHATNCKHIVITAGNHDAPGTIDAPKELLSALSIDVVGRASENLSEEVFKYQISEEQVIIAAVPYLRDQDIRRAVAGENFDDISERYRMALMNHYSAAAEYCNSINSESCPQIAMGHLFAIGGQPSDSEQNIYVGNLGDIAAKDFPHDFDYIALGHLHRPQIVDKNVRIRYSGSPNILSFSELNYAKKVIEIEIVNNAIKNIIELEIPRFREITKVEGNLQECLIKLERIESNEFALTPWIEVVLDNVENNKIGFADIQHKVEELNKKGLKFEVLKVTNKNQRNTVGLNKIISDSNSIKDLTPIEVFKEKCKEQNFDLVENEEILDAFNEIVNIIKEGKE
ncbi:MAG: exonuclease SbcCD subunit D C-terminal domain-containing protein [Bacteroidales bacterium]|nr:exonuclease SbcCD subunit D C-terminal domain-containing protein [Bacteroidales bacterium]